MFDRLKKKNAKDVWICAEFKSGVPTESTLQLVCEGRRLADGLRASAGVVAMAPGQEQRLEYFNDLGVDYVFSIEDGGYLSRSPEIAAQVFSGLCRGRSPFLILFCMTPSGSDLAARVAAKLGAGMITGADRLWISEQGDLLATRLCCERKIHETLRCRPGATHVATVAPGPAKKGKDISGTPRVESVPVPQDAAASRRVRITGVIKGDPRTIDISDAEVIVAGGKGVENPETFSLLQEMADLLKASVAGSRVAVDNGYIGRERQIGQSGKSVSPELIISCGISGAQAHTVGMRDAKSIVCINTDANAPMMKMAQLGVVGDAGEVIPRLIDLIREHSGPAKRRHGQPISQQEA
jgi:electron transfer flavoprotein alpha subunit